MNTAAGEHHRLGLNGLRFGIVAPSAAQRTALEKNAGAYARTVVDGKGHNIRNHATHGSV